MSSKPEAFYKLKCSCNQYPWGKQGSGSMAARLCAKQVGWDGEKGEGKTRTDFKIDEDNSYAEMWMGTYPELPSYIEETGEDLQDVIDQYPDELVGKTVLEKFGHSKIPFLPKVLSIAKALPLQIHPNKEVATRLHKENPDQFTDPNHKPEIALALGKFEAFCGFKPLDKIAALLKLDPLKQYLPNDASGSFDDGQLKDVVRNMLEADKPTVKKTYDSLVSLSKDSFGEDTHILELAPRLASQYGETDPGTLVALITMNYLVLHAGDSIYIPADGIHAYLSGDIIECMARSNNVLNTGFCPRAERDSIVLFMQCLTFKPHSLEDSILKATKYEGGKEGKTLLYSPPMNEFDMLATLLKEGEKEVLKSVNGPSILIAAKGGAEMTIAGKKVQLGEGQVYFVTHGNAIELVAGKDGLDMYTSFVQ